MILPIDDQTTSLGRYRCYLTRVNLSANRVPPDANEDNERADKKTAKTEESYDELEARDVLARSRTRQGEGRDEVQKKTEESGWREREAARSEEENEDAK